jgi:hypothetical protein
MATDGVKIIDGDDAHDLYWGIMDLYDNGANIQTIQEKYPVGPAYYDFDYEIHITAYALAFWEIGAMTDELLREVRVAIDKGVGVAEWTEECGESEGKARQQELDKLWRKISKPNQKVRKRKKYRQVIHFHFQPNDVLAFQIPGKCYRAVICAKVDQYRGSCHYLLVPTTYNSYEKPTNETLLREAILGLRIASSGNWDMIKQRQPDIESLWALYPGLRAPFFFGAVYIGISHTDFQKFKTQFEKVDSLKIKDSLLVWHGSSRYESTFEGLEEVFSDLEGYTRVFRQEKFPISAVCEIS